MSSKQTELKRDLEETDLAAALDESARAGIALGIRERELVDQMIARLRALTSGDVIGMNHEPRKMYDPYAGP
jgi:hypothetical protein